MGIFKAYDIRGVVPSELDAELARKIGNAFARFLSARRLVVGQDMRSHSPEIADAVSAGMRDAGCDVIRLGLASTPMTYFAIATLECDGGLCVTASHNPGQYNGMKLCREGARPISMATGIGEIEALCRQPYPAPAARRGAEEPADLLADYADHVARFARLARPIEVAIDAGNGMAGYTLPSILERVPRVRAHTKFMELDGSFPNHEANPLKEENLADVKALVRASGAEVGVAFDGDADRVLFVDGHSRVVDGDQTMAICAIDLANRDRLPGSTVVVTVMTNLGFRLAMAERGINVVDTKVGDRYVLEALEAGGYALGGEQSGHVIFRELATTGDGLLTAVQLLDVVVRSGRSLGMLADDAMTRLPQVLRNVRVDGSVPAGELAEQLGPEIAQVQEGLGSTGRVLVRPSGTEPLVRVMVEAPTEAQADAAATHLVRALESFVD
jgi:phosphomannomutase